MPTIITTGSMAASAFGFARNKITAAVDSFFNYVTLLLNGDAANGASGTFISDASTNAFALTAGGSPINSINNPFQAGYYSNTFDGNNSNYLAIASTTSLNFGTNAFTIEGWFNTSNTGATQVFNQWNTGNQRDGVYFGWYSSNQFWWAIGDGSTWVFERLPSVTVPVNQWFHLAMVRSSGTARLYLNGVQIDSVANSTSTSQQTSNNSYVGGNPNGYYMNGNISNLRVINGTNLYPNGTTFTPSTTPLTAVTNTQLLTCQSNRFIDNSSNNLTIYLYGSPTSTVSQNQPFTYTTPVTYGSGLFNGTSDYLETASSATLTLGTGSWTVECWVYITSNAANLGIFGTGNATGCVELFTNGSNGITYNFFGASGTSNSYGTNMYANQWNHVALTRSSGNLYISVNGATSSGFAAGGSDTAPGTLFDIGQAKASRGWYLPGGISNFRVTIGTALYTTSYTVPTAPLTASANTKLLTVQNNVAFQNNTFIDSSLNNFPITRTGNVTQGSFSPYGTLWSNYFNGSSSLSSSATGITNFGTSNFTVEFWVNYSSSSFNGNYISGAYSSGTNNCIALQYYGGYIQLYSTNNALEIQAAWTPTVGSWNHIALVRSGGTYTIYVNGVSVGTNSPTLTNFTDSGQYIAYAGPGTAGYFNGYMSNIRTVKGTAVYTSNFTPSTTPLTAISGTSLLTAQSNRFIDTSSNNITLTINNGSPTVQRFSPFNPTSAYSTSVIGGSAYWNGSGDYLSAPSSPVWATGTGDFTYQAWIFQTNTSASLQSIVNFRTGNINNFEIRIDGTQPQLHWDGTLIFNGSSNLIAGQWNHLAVTRSSGTMRMYLNGVSIGSTSTTYTFDQYTTAYFGGYGGGGAGWSFYGYMSGVQFINGTALYSGSTYTIPTAPPTAVTNTQALLNYTNAGIPDLAMMNDLQTLGSAQVNTSVKKYGTGSLSFNGTNSYLTSTVSINWTKLGNFTIEGWIYVTSLANDFCILGTKHSSGNQYSFFYVHSDGSINFGINGINELGSAAGAITTNTWYYVTVVYNSPTLTIYVNGSSVASSGSGSTYLSNNSQTLWIGYDGVAGHYFPGYMDDLRFTTGYARYTGNFTPPTAALPTY